MAIAPVHAAGGVQAQDLEDEEIIGTDGEGQDGSEGSGQTEDDATLYAGEEQGDGGEEAPLDEEEEDFFPAPRAPESRAQTRIQRLADENARLKAQLEGRAPATGQPPIQSAPAKPMGETDEQFQARIAALPPDERAEAKTDRLLAKIEQQQATQQFNAVLESDRLAFEQKCLTDKRYKRWAPAVEEERKKLAAQGQYVQRENILAFLLGKRMLSPEGAKDNKQVRERSQERVRRAEARPVNTRGDAAPTRQERSAKAARDKRLENLRI